MISLRHVFRPHQTVLEAMGPKLERIPRFCMSFFREAKLPDSRNGYLESCNSTNQQTKDKAEILFLSIPVGSSHILGDKDIVGD